MKIALLGNGKMGQAIAEIAPVHQTEIVATKDSKSASGKLQEADLWIDFSSASCIRSHIALAIEHKKNIVIGTTGWEQQRSELLEEVKKSPIGLLYAPNFSIGTAIFFQLVKKAAELTAPLSYETALFEKHHKHKKDAPSGTSKALLRLLPDKTECASLRLGEEVGTHSVIFDSPNDTLTLTHEAKNRLAFAQGALLAAKWLQGKKGVFTLEDYVKEVLK